MKENITSFKSVVQMISRMTHMAFLQRLYGPLFLRIRPMPLQCWILLRCSISWTLYRSKSHCSIFDA